MGVGIKGQYTGKKKTEMIHEPSGSIIATEAPKDNGGEGLLFSPTDLVAAAFGSCVVTTIAIVAERSGIDITGTHFRVEKEMQQDPRRIGSIPLEVHLPGKLTDAERQKVELAGRACPVHKTLHPEVKADIRFVYDV